MTGIFQLADPNVHKLLSFRACGTCRGVCLCEHVCLCVCVPPTEGEAGVGLVGWLGVSSL